MSGAATTLRELMRSGEPLRAIGAHDPLSARLIEQAGFEVIYLGGFAASASMLGEPDLGLMTQSEMADHIRRVSAVTSLPIIVDADNGHGSALNVARTVKSFSRMGAAAIHLEDQVLPKKCGHLEGKAVIPPQDMVQKIRAALDAREDDDFVIIARTDAIPVEGISGAIDRAAEYAGAGADALFVDAPETMEQLQLIGDSLKRLEKPLVFNYAAGLGKSPALSASQCKALGFNVILHPVELMLSGIRASTEILRLIKASDELSSIRPLMTSFSEIKEILSITEAEEFEASYPVGRM